MKAHCLWSDCYGLDILFLLHSYSGIPQLVLPYTLEEAFSELHAYIKTTRIAHSVNQTNPIFTSFNGLSVELAIYLKGI